MTAADARESLRRAHERHAAGRIDEALDAARRAIKLDPTDVEAWTYFGTTLVTRRLAFAEGLDALERALSLAPDDPGVSYSLGWCYEFVAYRLETRRPEPAEEQATRPLRQAQGKLYRDPDELYELAATYLQRCIDLDPEPGLKEDAQDLLNSILDRL